MFTTFYDPLEKIENFPIGTGSSPVGIEKWLWLSHCRWNTQILLPLHSSIGTRSSRVGIGKWLLLSHYRWNTQILLPHRVHYIHHCTHTKIQVRLCINYILKTKITYKLRERQRKLYWQNLQNHAKREETSTLRKERAILPEFIGVLSLKFHPYFPIGCFLPLPYGEFSELPLLSQSK